MPEPLRIMGCSVVPDDEDGLYYSVIVLDAHESHAEAEASLDELSGRLCIYVIETLETVPPEGSA